MAGREGEIEKQAQAVGMKKALAKMAELMLHEVPDTFPQPPGPEALLQFP